MFRPMGDRVVAKRFEPKIKTSGGIYLSKGLREVPMEGLVLAVGDENKEIKVDDRILFGKYAGTEVTVEEQEYLILRKEEILGVF